LSAVISMKAGAYGFRYFKTSLKYRLKVLRSVRLAIFDAKIK